MISTIEAYAKEIYELKQANSALRYLVIEADQSLANQVRVCDEAFNKVGLLSSLMREDQDESGQAIVALINIILDLKPEMLNTLLLDPSEKIRSYAVIVREDRITDEDSL